MIAKTPLRYGETWGPWHGSMTRGLFRQTYTIPPGYYIEGIKSTIIL